MTYTRSASSALNKGNGSNDDDLDERAHARLHSLLMDGTPISTQPLQSGLDGSAELVSSHASVQIYIIPYPTAPSCPAHMKSKLDTVFQVMQRDLGSVPISQETLKKAKVFVAVCRNESRIVGCVVAEPIEWAYVYRPNASSSSTDNTSDENVEPNHQLLYQID